MDPTGWRPVSVFYERLGGAMRALEAFPCARAIAKGFGCGAAFHEDVGRNAAKTVDRCIPGRSAGFL
jgi:hypothetical protein